METLTDPLAHLHDCFFFLNPSGLQRLNSMGRSCLAYSGADRSPLFITRASGGIVIEIFILIISASQKSKQDQEQPRHRDAADRGTRGRWVTKERRDRKRAVLSEPEPRV